MFKNNTPQSNIQFPSLPSIDYSLNTANFLAAKMIYERSAALMFHNLNLNAMNYFQNRQIQMSMRQNNQNLQILPGLKLENNNNLSNINFFGHPFQNHF